MMAAIIGFGAILFLIFSPFFSAECRAGLVAAISAALSVLFMMNLFCEGLRAANLYSHITLFAISVLAVAVAAIPAFGGTTIILVACVILHVTNYGSLYRSEFILRLRVETSDGEPAYNKILNRYSKQANILHIEPSGERQTTLVAFDVIMNKDLSPEAFTRDLGQIEGVSEFTLIASNNDMDY
jgi:hypothetical protein